MSVVEAVGDPTYFAYGFHGSSVASIEAIMLTGYFELSDHSHERGEGDWLGPGFYFWQDAPTRVWEWLRAPRQQTRLGSHVETLVAKIRLADCVDLLDTGSHALLRRAYIRFVNRFPLGTTVLTNPTDPTAPPWHPLDDAIVRTMLERAALRGQTIRSMRATFREGDPIVPGSALHDLDHVQIAVFHDSVIVDYWAENSPPP